MDIGKKDIRKLLIIKSKSTLKTIIYKFKILIS